MRLYVILLGSYRRLENCGSSYWVFGSIVNQILSELSARFINTLNISWIFIWISSTNFLLSDIHSRLAVVLGVFSAGCLYVVLSSIVETKWL